MTNDHPLVSVIVPCYNYGNFIGFALQSVNRQSYDNWECIIVDDGSGDDTRKVAENFVAGDSRYRYVYQPNEGLSSARNTGIREAKGKYVQFLDADDLIHAGKIALQVKYLETHPGSDLVYGDAVFFRDNARQDVTEGNLKRNKIKRLKRSGAGIDIIKNLCVNNFIEISAPLVRTSLIRKVGIFKPLYRTYEDWQYWIRAAAEGACFAFEPMPETVTYIRYGHSSMLGNVKMKIKYGIMIREFVKPYLPPLLKIYNQYRLSKLYIKKALLILKKS